MHGAYLAHQSERLHEGELRHGRDEVDRVEHRHHDEDLVEDGHGHRRVGKNKDANLEQEI